MCFGGSAVRLRIHAQSRCEFPNRIQPRRRSMRWCSDIHVFDEPQRDSTFEARTSERDNLVLVHPFSDHGIHLDKKADFSLPQCLQELSRSELFRIRHGLERCFVHGIKADGDSVQTRFMKRAGVCVEQGTVGGQAMSSSGPVSRSMEISSVRSLRNRGSPPSA